MNHPSMFDEKRARNRIVRRITVIILAVFLLVIATGAAVSYAFVKRSLEPVDPSSTESVEVEVPLGAGSGYIGELLEENGLVRNSTIFRFYTRFKNESSFQAGTYTLSPSQSLDELIATLKTGKVIVVPDIKLVIPEGFTIDQVISRLAKEADIPKEEISAQLSDEEYIRSLVNEHEMLTDEVLADGIYHPLEGYLFPATYEFDKGVTLTQIIDEMLKPTEQLYAEYQSEVEASGRTFHETLALASVVEKEAVSTEDRQEIAGVFENRLADGMKLQSDPTVWYGTGRRQSSHRSTIFKTTHSTTRTATKASRLGRSLRSVVTRSSPPSTRTIRITFISTPDHHVKDSRTGKSCSKWIMRRTNKT